MAGRCDGRHGADGIDANGPRVAARDRDQGGVQTRHAPARRHGDDRHGRPRRSAFRHDGHGRHLGHRDAPTLLICVNRAASIHDIIVETGRYCVNILGTHHAGLVGPFGGGADGEARFGHGAWTDELGGMPYLDDAQASLFCEIRQNVPYGSHSVLIGEVMSVHLSDEIAPLLYQDGALAASRLLGL